MSLNRTAQRTIVAALLSACVLTILVTAWLLWPTIHIYSVRRAALNGSTAQFWWPTSWRNELEATQKLVTCIKKEEGVMDVDGRFRVAPGDVEGFAKKVKDVNGDEAAVQVLITLLEDQKQTTASRVLAAIALGMFGTRATDAEPALIGVLQATRDDVPGYRRLPFSERQTVKIPAGAMLRWASAYALGTMGPKAQRAVPALKEAAADPYSLVAEPALRSWKRIDPSAPGYPPVESP